MSRRSALYAQINPELYRLVRIYSGFHEQNLKVVVEHALEDYLRRIELF